MRRSAAVIIILACVISCAAVVMADTQEGQWHDKINIAGFNITSVKPQNSGSATGTLSLGSLGNQQVTLTKSSNDEITGSVSLKTSASGADIQGKLILDSSGLEGRGTIGSSPKISDASIAISPNGQATGTGRVTFGSIAVNTQFEIGSSFNVSGSVNVRKQADTTLALYSFNGTLDLKGSSGKISIYANGEVQRTGKLAKQINTQRVSDVEVSPSNGQATINVDGVNVTFKFF